MGFEYNFKMSKIDIENLSKCVDGIDNLDKLLRSAPHFFDKHELTYSYSEVPDNKDRWPSNISINQNGFCICIYDSSPASKDIDLFNYLMHQILERCGRVEVEDA